MYASKCSVYEKIDITNTFFICSTPAKQTLSNIAHKQSNKIKYSDFSFLCIFIFIN